ncbi:prsW [Symbiodinium natans]|uniref:PrsW protein n=1 Tax=Symbiodinium natans TaxID=878477 RepID=A0A812QPA5_9DINO|nr:prsW [Symbiodinium natans]
MVELWPEGSEGRKRLWVRLPPSREWEPGSSLTAFYELDDGVLHPGIKVEPCPPRFCTSACFGWGAGLFSILTLCTGLCVLPYVLLPPLGLALLSLVPVLVFGSFVQFYFQDSVKLSQMVISFFEAIAWILPLAGAILIIYFPLGWQDWVSNCQEVSSAEENVVNADCLGKRALQAYLMTAFLEELLKYICVRRILWFPFVADPWALCCYGGCAGLGFAALENALYVGSGSLFTALLRAGTAVPNHLMYGLLHGAFLSEQRFSLKLKRRCPSFMLTPMLPILLHGSHNFSIAVCQYVNLWLGLALMLVVAVSAVCILRMALVRQQFPTLNVHDLIKSGLVEAPHCCCCCQGVCGWAPKTAPPYLIPVDSHAGGVLEPLVGEATQVRGVGMGTFEARADEQSLVASLQCSCTKGKWYFETVVGPHARNCRTGFVQVGSSMTGQLGGDSKSWGFGDEGLWHGDELVQNRTHREPSVVGALLDLDDGTLMFMVDGVATQQVHIDTTTGWLPAWSFTGTLGVRLDGRFAFEPPQGFSPIRRAAMSDLNASPQVVGILLSDSQSEL